MRKGLTRSADPPTSRRAGPLRVLFICSRNRRRSPTAEAVFSGRDDLDVASAGLAPDAEEVVNAETLESADMIFVMEKAHRARLQRRFAPHIRHARIVCLNIPDRYEFMDEALVQRLESAVAPLLRRRA
jgi:predicted protein tyrosine phosphatase